MAKKRETTKVFDKFNPPERPPFVKGVFQNRKEAMEFLEKYPESEKYVALYLLFEDL